MLEKLQKSYEYILHSYFEKFLLKMLSFFIISENCATNNDVSLIMSYLSKEYFVYAVILCIFFIPIIFVFHKEILENLKLFLTTRKRIVFIPLMEMVFAFIFFKLIEVNSIYSPLLTIVIYFVVFYGFDATRLGNIIYDRTLVKIFLFVFLQIEYFCKTQVFGRLILGVIFGLMFVLTTQNQVNHVYFAILMLVFKIYFRIKTPVFDVVKYSMQLEPDCYYLTITEKGYLESQTKLFVNIYSLIKNKNREFESDKNVFNIDILLTNFCVKMIIQNESDKHFSINKIFTQYLPIFLSSIISGILAHVGIDIISIHKKRLDRRLQSLESLRIRFKNAYTTELEQNSCNETCKTLLLKEYTSQVQIIDDLYKKILSEQGNYWNLFIKGSEDPEFDKNFFELNIILVKKEVAIAHSKLDKTLWENVWDWFSYFWNYKS